MTGASEHRVPEVSEWSDRLLFPTRYKTAPVVICFVKLPVAVRAGTSSAPRAFSPHDL